jgi:hypothetical protein
MGVDACGGSIIEDPRVVLDNFSVFPIHESISPSIVKVTLASYSILCWQFFIQYSDYDSPFSLTCRVCAEFTDILKSLILRLHSFP